jgi:KaiC/GvpD/RAD55 family RecA-like ATPase
MSEAERIVGEKTARAVHSRPLSQVTPRAVRWLVRGLIPLRTLTLVAGVGGLGKSTYLMGVAAQVTRGEHGPPGACLIVSSEDTAEEILRPRAQAADGDLDLIHHIYVDLDDGGIVMLPTDLGGLEQRVREHEAGLVVIDPIVAALHVDLDAHKDQHVRVVLARLTRVAEETGCAVCLVAHLNKAPSKDPYLRIGGSVAFWNAARSVILVTADPADPDESRLVTQRKANWARMVPVQRHRIEETQLDTLDPETGRPIITSRMVYVEDADDVEREDILDERDRSHDGGDRLARAVVFLIGALADGGWHDSAGLKTLAGAQGISERTLKRAAKELDVEHERRGFPSSTYWRLKLGQRSPHNGGPTGDGGGTSHGYAESDGQSSQSGQSGHGDREDGLTEMRPVATWATVEEVTAELARDREGHAVSLREVLDEIARQGWEITELDDGEPDPTVGRPAVAADPNGPVARLEAMIGTDDFKAALDLAYDGREISSETATALHNQHKRQLKKRRP